MAATVTPSTATGTVTFSNGKTCVLVSGSCQAITTAILPLGATSLTATYGGDTNDAASPASPAQTVTVVVNPTTVAASAYQLGTTIPLANSAIIYGNSFTLSATVTASGSVAVPTSSGHVSFYDSSTLLGTATINSSGVATLATSTTLAAGRHYFIASYGGVYSTSGAAEFSTSLSSAAQVTISQATPLTITASSPSVVYGSPVPVIAPSYTGFVSPDTSSTIAATKQPICTTTYTATSPVGTYPTSCASAVDTNYTISYAAGSVTVTGATPTWSNFNSAAVNYGTAIPLAASSNSSGAITYQISSSSHGGPYMTVTSVPATQTPGTYYVTATVAANGNYATGSTQRTVTVNPAPLTITAPSPASISFGSAIPTLNASNAVFGTFVNGETSSVLAGTLTCTTDYTTISAPATYITSCRGLTSNNYAISYAEGSFVVTAVQPTITWPATAGAITYGHAQSSSTLGACSATFNGSPVAGTCAWTTPSTIPHVGAAQSVTWTPSAGEYASDYAAKTNATLSFANVTAATPTISSQPVASSIPVGSALSASKLSGGSVTFTVPATSSVVTVPGTFSWEASVAPSVPGTSNVEVTFTPSGTYASDYNTVTNAGNASLTVTKATPTITTVPTASAITYGQTLSNSTLTLGAASEPGTFAWASPTTIPAKGTINESVIFTPTAATPQLYNTVTFTVPVVVNGVSLYVSSWPTASSINYGQFLSNSNLSGGLVCSANPCTVSNHVTGKFAWTSSDNASTNMPDVGVPAPSVTFTPTSTNYAVTSGTVAVTVNPIEPMVTVWPTASPIFTPAYLSAANWATSGAATGLGAASVSGTFAFTNGSSIQPGAGYTQYDVTFTPANNNQYGSSDYGSVNGSVYITVNPCGKQDATNGSFSTANGYYSTTQPVSELSFDLEGSINESVVCADQPGTTITLTDPEITSGSGTTYQTDSITNGTNAAVLVYGPVQATPVSASGATVAIVNDGSIATTINTTSDYANGVFATMGGTVSINDGGNGTTFINTSGQGAHALAATLAGTLTVTNVQATTTGKNSAVITTGGGGGGLTPPGAGIGTVTVNGGSYISSGVHSSGIRAAGIGTPFSTITVTDTVSAPTTIAALNDAAVVVEGGNSVNITSANANSLVSGAGGDYHGIFLYLGAKGSSSAGSGTFGMTGGTLSFTCDASSSSASTCDQNGTAILSGDQNYPATLFSVTNTTLANPANINLTDVTVINTTPSDTNPNGTLLTAAALSAGMPAYVNFTAQGEQLTGDIIVDTTSTANLNLEWDGTSGTALTGNIGGPASYYTNQTAGTINLTLDAHSTWVVTGNSYLTTLVNPVSNNSNITCASAVSCQVYVNGTPITIGN
jgi:hypothetical protein